MVASGDVARKTGIALAVRWQSDQVGLVVSQGRHGGRREGVDWPLRPALVGERQYV